MTPNKLLALFALLLLPLAGCGPKKPSGPAQPPPAKVTAAEPILREIIEWDEYTGRLRAPESVEIRPRVSGYLDSINFKDGQMVKKGDLLFVIDPRPYQAELDRAQAALTQAQAQLELAKTNFARSKELQRKQVIAQQEFDSQSNDLRAAEAQVASAQAAVATAQLNLDFTHVMAPISGRVSRYNVSVGNLISGTGAEATLLTTIVSLDPLYCYFEVDEQSFLKYSDLAKTLAPTAAPGEPETATGMPVEMKVSNEEGFPHRGALDFVDNQVDTETSTVELRGVFPNADMKLTPGLFARVRIPAREKYEAILIPDEAIGANQSVQFVYVIDAEKKAQVRPVQLGPIADGLRVIRKGVKPGDLIVVGGLQRVRPGAVVDATVEAADKAAAEAPARSASDSSATRAGDTGASSASDSDTNKAVK